MVGEGWGGAGGRCPPAHCFQGYTAWLPQFGWRLQPGLCPGLCLQAAQLCQRLLICAGCWQETLQVSPVIRLGAPGKQSLQVTGRGQARVLAAQRWGRGSLPTPLAHPVVSAGESQSGI